MEIHTFDHYNGWHADGPVLGSFPGCGRIRAGGLWRWDRADALAYSQSLFYPCSSAESYRRNYSSNFTYPYVKSYTYSYTYTCSYSHSDCCSYLHTYTHIYAYALADTRACGG